LQELYLYILVKESNEKKVYQEYNLENSDGIGSMEIVFEIDMDIIMILGGRL